MAKIEHEDSDNSDKHNITPNSKAIKMFKNTKLNADDLLKKEQERMIKLQKKREIKKKREKEEKLKKEQDFKLEQVWVGS